ncbi:MAG TPA: hypothetical protein VGL89_10550 [Candidatus Koribacter sp.]
MAIAYDAAMQPADIQQEFSRLGQYYRSLASEELENIAAQAFALTDTARQALSFEISSRGLPIVLNLTPPLDEQGMEALPPEDDGFVPDDQDLACVHVAHELKELLAIKKDLNHRGIECFFGDDNLRDVSALPAKFHGDMPICVWRHQMNEAIKVLTATVPGYGAQEEAPNLEVRCPKCNSDGVVFEERDLDSTGGKLTNQSKFHWVCDDCGYEWEDDGIASERPKDDAPADGR